MEKRPNYCNYCYAPTMGTTKCDKHKEGPKQNKVDSMSYKDHQRKQETSKNFDSVYDSQ